jgi:hypothetical protein
MLSEEDSKATPPRDRFHKNPSLGVKSIGATSVVATLDATGCRLNTLPFDYQASALERLKRSHSVDPETAPAPIGLGR